MTNPHHDFIHPGLQPGEILFTNASSARFETMPWRTKRLGQVAHDGIGNKLNHLDWFPVFLALQELRQSGNSLQQIRKRWQQAVNQAPLTALS